MDKSGFIAEFVGYLFARKWLLIVPVLIISVILIVIAGLLFGSDVALNALYQIF
jgi:hypothetical protein